ncbi:MAG TPA: hypothetical protein VGU71_22335 [Candidatus Dormibacteraeota bacterium]|nr:hypothetical protein [Candidatus Dormibacteraeota bacterium]
MRDLALPPAPPLFAAEVPAPTPQEKQHQELGGPFEVLSSCRWCWGQHPGACPYIKQVEWHPNGQVSRVLLKERAQHEKLILYPGEETDDALRRALGAIAEAKTLSNAREIASTLLKLMDEEKPG